MINRTIRRGLPIFFGSAPSFYKSSLSKYSPPPSQFQEFKKHLQNLEDQKSLQKAASLMSQLQIDQNLYKDALLTLDMQKQKLRNQNSTIVDLVNRVSDIESDIDNQITENKSIESRCLKEMENIKVYGISKIAKNVIEISDHISEAVRMLKNRSDHSEADLKQLQQVQKELNAVFDAYNIHEFDPKGSVFNPNEHQSIGQVAAEDQLLKNTIAQTKRTGFKLKDRLLRSAYVVIYA